MARSVTMWARELRGAEDGAPIPLRATAFSGHSDVPVSTLRDSGEEGFLLIGAIVAIFIVLLLLSVAAPTMARQLRREREVEAVHRGNQYVRAIQLYYRKFGHYPGTMEQLKQSNNIRFLRQEYLDPMTGKSDWRLIHIGEQKTTVKGLFGKPLAGVASAGLGSAAGMASGRGMGTSAASSGTTGGLFGTSSGAGASGSDTAASGSAGFGNATSGAGGAATLGAGGTGSVGGAFGAAGTGTGQGQGGIASQSASTFGGTGAPFVGVGSSAVGDSIVVLNEQTTYPTWEFLYDPRIEQIAGEGKPAGGWDGEFECVGAGEPERVGIARDDRKFDSQHNDHASSASEHDHAAAVDSRRGGSAFRWSGFEGVVAELADATVGADDEGEREGVPVFVGVGGLAWAGPEGRPVPAVVPGDVGAVGAGGYPRFRGWGRRLRRSGSRGVG